MKKKKQLSLAARMGIALAAAVLVGAVCMALRESLNSGGHEDTWNFISRLLFADITADDSAIGLFYLIGQLFIRALSLIIVPIIYTSLVLAMIRIADAKRLKRIFLKTVGLFLLTTVLGLAFAAVCGMAAFRTGVFHVTIENLEVSEGSAGSNPLNVILNIIPSNLGTAFSSNGAVLAIVFLAIVSGLVMQTLGEKRTETFRKLVTEVNDMVLTFLNFVVDKFGPFAVFCLLVRTMASYGIAYLKPALAYMVLTAVLLLVYLFAAYPAVIAAFARLNPLKFMKKIAKVAVFGFSTSSSAAALSLNTKTCREDLGISEEITSFVLPLGMTVNMDGTAIMQVVAALFIAGVSGSDVTLSKLLMIALLALVASVGTPAAPGSGAVVLFTILSGAGFTSDAALLAYSLVLAINRPIEMLVTALNVVGDAATCTVVAETEHCLDEETYRS